MNTNNTPMESEDLYRIALMMHSLSERMVNRAVQMHEYELHGNETDRRHAENEIHSLMTPLANNMQLYDEYVERSNAKYQAEKAKNPDYPHHEE